MRHALSPVIVFVVITPAVADIVLQSSPGSPLPAGNLVQYTISAVGTEGETIGLFANPSITAVGNGAGVHHVWQAATDFATPTKTWHTAGLWNGDWSAYDTYFLFDGTQAMQFGLSVDETNDRATFGTLGLSRMPVDYVPISGFGAYVSNNLPNIQSLLPQWRSSNVPFMQVVLRAQDSARLQVLIGDAVEPQTVEREIIIGPFVPEPATWLLATVAGLAWHLCRRK